MNPRSTRLGVVFLAGLALGAGCRRHSATVAAEMLPTIKVRVAVVEKRSLPTLIEVSGTVRSVQRATLAAKISGPIERLPLALGQRVSAGEELLTIAAPEWSARADQARAKTAQVERELARERGLLANGSGTAETVKSLEDHLAQTRAAQREAETMLGEASVRAPFDGVVTRKHVEAGDFAAAGAPLLQLDGRDVFEIETAVPESLAVGLAVDAALEIETSPGARFSGRIKELALAADAAARAVTVRMAVPAGREVRPGEFVRVFVPSRAQDSLLAPATVLSRFGQMERVFVAEDGRAVLRIVKTGATHGDRIEFVAGVDAGERLILAPPPLLRDGQPLEIVP